MILFSSAVLAGLSPLARGTLDRWGQHRRTWRFIPAGAGNTALPLRIGCLLAVYPRWRGEHVVRTADAFEIVGLSPLARGTRKLHESQLPDERFIPAGAGNTVYADWI
ncbi:hypothetical protein CFSAN001078_03896 [Salmonella enterica subsp. enterica serovar Manhattan str. CFSAN001078]|nr:hypothetical protein CFSAN001078_03896 [Salmonella enterica subsp. enterica serovar Manhattan str. CFSAN001078]